jgi:Na+/H+-dicarboxylate symporter/ABC-type amino acid transport substrate-binding protein
MKKKVSLSNKVIIALVAGIICGLLFGEMCSYLEPFTVAFIKIMQITVIPYIVFSLLHGIGGLTKKQAKTIAIKGSLVLIAFWVITIILFFSMQFTFPAIKTASFYSSLDSNIQTTNYYDLFIPSNPFASLSNSAIPAVIIFCVLLGIAFISIKSEEKVSILNLLNILRKSIECITRMLIMIIPYGTFVITAYTAGTITGHNLEVLAIYIIGQIVCSLFILLLVVPLIISSLTRYSYYHIFSETKGILIFTFVTGNLFITLPLIIESVKSICLKYDNDDEYIDAQAQTLIPIYYSFPVIGKFSVLFFVLFAAWLYGTELNFINQLEFASIGLFSLFSSPYFAVPFLLNYLEIPIEAFDLYVGTSQITRKFSLVLDVMGLFACTLISINLSSNLFKLNMRKLLKSLIMICFVFIVILTGLKILFSKTFTNLYTGDEQVLSMVLPETGTGKSYSDIVSAKVYKEITKHLLNTEANNIDKIDVLSQIIKRKVLRVGYNTLPIPFSFFNSKGDLVGADIQLAYELAIFMNCPKIEFIPIEYNSLAKMLDNRVCDIVMSSVSMTPERMSNMLFSSSYLTQTIALLVKDSRKKEFSTTEKIQKIENLKVVINKNSVLAPIIKKMLPNAKIIKLTDVTTFFDGKTGDALVGPAYEGFSYSLLYPEYTVAEFTPNANLKQLIAYPISKNGGESFCGLVNAWLDMNTKNGLIDKTIDYWILGKKDPDKLQKRWSILRDVLHIVQ